MFLLQVAWLKEHVATTYNMSTILEYTASTFAYRQQQISTCLKDSTLILENYPRFVDAGNGILVSKEILTLKTSKLILFLVKFQIIQEFLTLQPNAKSFKINFIDNFLAKIEKMAQAEIEAEMILSHGVSTDRNIILLI